MKLSPKWDEVRKFTRSINTLLDLTEGRNVKQLSAEEGVRQFCASDCLGVSKQNIEYSAYGLRCMVSQLMNHKRRSRRVPAAFAASFATTMDKLYVQDAPPAAICNQIRREWHRKSEVQSFVHRARHAVETGPG